MVIPKKETGLRQMLRCPVKADRIKGVFDRKGSWIAKKALHFRKCKIASVNLLRTSYPILPDNRQIRNALSDQKADIFHHP